MGYVGILVSGPELSVDSVAADGLVLLKRPEMSKQVLRMAIDTYSGHVQLPEMQVKDTFGDS